MGRPSNGAENLAEDIAIGQGCTTAETHSSASPPDLNCRTKPAAVFGCETARSPASAVRHGAAGGSLLQGLARAPPIEKMIISLAQPTCLLSSAG